MTIFKKSIALLISIFIGAANLQVYAQKQYTDIVDTKYYEAASFFEDLGIIKGLTPEEFKPDVGISRAEFAIMLAAILGFETEGLNIAAAVFRRTRWKIPQSRLLSTCISGI